MVTGYSAILVTTHKGMSVKVILYYAVGTLFIAEGNPRQTAVQ